MLHQLVDSADERLLPRGTLQTAGAMWVSPFQAEENQT